MCVCVCVCVCLCSAHIFFLLYVMNGVQMDEQQARAAFSCSGNEKHGFCLFIHTATVRGQHLRIDSNCKSKSKGSPRQAEVALGVPGRLRPRIFLTFGTTRVLGRQPNAPAAFTPREIPGTHFQRLSRPQGTWVCRKEPLKKSQVTPPGIDPGTFRLVAQRLIHYATLDSNCRFWFLDAFA